MPTVVCSERHRSYLGVAHAPPTATATKNGSIETQDALGHRHAATTRVYVQPVAIKKDKHSAAILDRLDLS